MSDRAGWHSVGRIAFLAFATLAVLAMIPVGALLSGQFRLFYIPSEAMLPGLQVGDRFVGRMGEAGPLRRGDVVLVRAVEGAYVKRVAALAGDRIEMIDGVVILNGARVEQQRVGVDRIDGGFFGDRAARLVERFPGEAAPHEIYDFGLSAGDDLAALTVPPGHVFLLGDNRDHSADSRFSREEMGLGGPVPVTDIVGRPWWFYHRVEPAAGRQSGR